MTTLMIAALMLGGCDNSGPGGGRGGYDSGTYTTGSTLPGTAWDCACLCDYEDATTYWTDQPADIDDMCVDSAYTDQDVVDGYLVGVILGLEAQGFYGVVCACECTADGGCSTPATFGTE